jgi:predicted HAD superfamily phosphohydrolase
MRKTIYITDCEGPVTRNDNAYEIADAFLREGGKLFALLSKFDDYLGDIEKVEGYRYGSTLRFILPFLKTADVTDREIQGFSGQNITVVNGIREALQAINGLMPVYVVSTSYVHYIKEVCRYLGLNMANMFCTELSFDSYSMDEEERRVIADYHEQFLKFPPITWDSNNRIDPGSQSTVDALKAFFYDRLPSLPVYQWMKDVDPIGGRGKAEAIHQIVQQTGVPLNDVLYVGDSITDVDAFRLVKESRGLSVSFNGNRYAVQSAEYIVVSGDAAILRDIAIDFCHHGKDTIREGKVNETAWIFRREACNIEDVIALSEKTRKEVRGQAIGSLG